MSSSRRAGTLRRGEPAKRAGIRLTSKGQATRDRIVDTASRLISQGGVARTTIEDIQKTANVSASQLYHYFADKRALVRAVIGRRASIVLAAQQQVLDRLDSFEALEEWRNLMVTGQRILNCTGGCPIGSLASDLAETDVQARSELARSFHLWEGLIRSGLKAMRDSGQLRPDIETDKLALALLASIQGGLLLSQTLRDTRPLEAAFDSAIAYLRLLSA